MPIRRPCDTHDPSPAHRAAILVVLAAACIAAIGVAASWLTTTALAEPERDHAVALGAVRELPVWIVDAGVRDGHATAAVLGAHGTVWSVGDGATVRLTRGLRGEQATACGEAIVAVDGLGRLQRFARAPGERVAPGAAPPVSLLHRPLCLDAVARDEAQGLPGLGAVVAVAADGDVLLLDPDLRVRSIARGVRALPDAEPVVVALGGDVAYAVAVLADPTQRYRPGVLGDEVEAASVVLLALPSLEELTRWTVAAPAVIEARRATPWSAAGAVGLHVTISDDGSGSRLLSVAWDGGRLVPVALGPAMGGPSGWLHVLAAIDERVYVHHLPHLGGPIARYDLGDALAEPADSAPHVVTGAFDVRSHVLGERNLDRAVGMGTLGAGVDLLALPHADGRGVLWLRCDASGCRVLHDTRLPAPLATNLVVALGEGERDGLLAADVEGGVWWLPVPIAPRR